MPFSSARRAVFCVGLGFFLAGFATSHAQTNYYGAYGIEYPIAGSLPGDQTYPNLALNRNGGFVVWQDNITDPAGLGISAMRITSTLTGSGGVFAVNTPTTNDQQNARVALLNNGGAAFVWQGGPDNIQHIYARFLSASNIWVTTTNVAVSTFTTNFQSSPAVATLGNGNVIVVWSSFDQAGSNSQDDVYGQLLTTNGVRIGTNFLINVFTTYNQKSPAVAALGVGKFVVAWASEQERSIGTTNDGSNSIAQMTYPSSDIYVRIFTNSGIAANPLTGEILVDQANNPSGAPSIAAASDGSYMVTWCANDVMVPTNGWDIFARSFTNSTGGPAIGVNSYTYGDQYDPQISAVGGDYLIVWTSLGEDGSREGVYGQFVHENGALTGNQFRVNTTTVGPQMQPAVASDGVGQFLTVWTSFTFGPNSDDLYAQRYEDVNAVLAPMDAPFVWAPFVISNGVYQPELAVTWPAMAGLTVSNYEVFVNGGNTPMGIVTGECWTMTAANGLTTLSTNSFQVAYMTAAGFLSPLSPPTTAGTWSGLNWGGIPYEWMAEYFGGYLGNGNYNTRFWPPANSLVAAGGPTLLQVFATGGNPLIPATWLQTSLTRGAGGFCLSWNSQPGMTYQVQITSDFRTWNNFGAPIYAYGTNSFINFGSGGGGYYRVQLLQP